MSMNAPELLSLQFSFKKTTPCDFIDCCESLAQNQMHMCEFIVNPTEHFLRYLKICPQERKRLLSFVLVGGGPTGVEVAAELHDMIVEDLKNLYPSLMELVSIKIVAVSDHLLSAYDR